MEVDLDRSDIELTLKRIVRYIFFASIRDGIINFVLSSQQLPGRTFFGVPLAVSAGEIQCSFPVLAPGDLPAMPAIQWNVSVSNDNATFSSVVTVFVFDSQCLLCQSTPASCIPLVSWSVAIMKLYLMNRSRSDDWASQLF